MDILESKEVTVGGQYYVVTAMEAIDGMEFFDELVRNKGMATPRKIKEVIVKYVRVGGKKFTDKSFDTHFSRKYNDLGELFEQVMEFNFGEELPNDSSDLTKEEQDISEE